MVPPPVQRFTFLGIAVIIAVVAVIVLAGGDEQTERAANPARSATPKPKPPL